MGYKLCKCNNKSCGEYFFIKITSKKEYDSIKELVKYCPYCKSTKIIFEIKESIKNIVRAYNKNNEIKVLITWDTNKYISAEQIRRALRKYYNRKIKFDVREIK